jgi:hypothetical protein
VEVDGGLEVVLVPETARAALDGHDLAVQALGDAVGDRVPTVGDDVVEMTAQAFKCKTFNRASGTRAVSRRP